MKVRANQMVAVMICFVVLLAGSMGCANGSPATPDKVVLQLKWVHQAQFAGFYSAVENGFFAEENLEVELRPGGVGVDIVKEVVEGRADFGVVGGEYILISRDMGLPVKAIAVTYRINPFVLVTMPDSGILSPEDFAGKTANLGGTDGELQFRALLEKVGIPEDQVEIVPYMYSLDPFFEGEVDITPGFAAGSLYTILEVAPDANVIWPMDYGIHLYSDTLFTTDRLISEDPDLVLRFLRASLKGHQYALDHRDVALEVSLKYAVDPDPVVQQSMIDASIPLIYTGLDEIGWMQPAVWSGMYDILKAQGVVSKGFDLEEAYSMQFLEDVYGNQP